MKHTQSVSDLKAMAREYMLGKYGTAIVLAITLNAISIFIGIACEFTIDTNTIFGIVVFYIVQFLLSLVTCIFSVGVYRFYLNICQNRPFNISDLFYGFSHHPDKAILIELILSLIGFGCLLPFIGFLAAYILLKRTILIVLFTVALVLGILVFFYFSLTYSFAIALLADNKDHLSVTELLRESCRLMTGNKFRYFYMMVSFLGWMFLGLLTCGIAYLWINSYINCTSALFYLDISGRYPFGRQETADEPSPENHEDFPDYSNLY